MTDPQHGESHDFSRGREVNVQRCLDCDRLIERVPNGRLCGKCLRTDIRAVPSLGASTRYPADVSFGAEGRPDRIPVSDTSDRRKPGRNLWVDTASARQSRCNAPEGDKGQIAAPIVRAVLVARLHHNYGDTLYVRTKSVARETGYNSAVVASALDELTDSESEVSARPLRISTDRSTTRQRWQIRFVPRLERMGRVARPAELNEYAPVDLAFGYVRRALDAALDRNFDDSIYGKARRFTQESVFETRTVGECLRAIETGDRDGQGVAVRTREGARRSKYVVSRTGGDRS
jgi:hypothetical protein